MVTSMIMMTAMEKGVASGLGFLGDDAREGHSTGVREVGDLKASGRNGRKVSLRLELGLLHEEVGDRQGRGQRSLWERFGVPSQI